MSSLKGQLSNVEGSVKSMKAAVVVGSVLTVACLAAVFGVTILANEVSKEVKVSNNTLTTKAGKPVLAANTVVTSKSLNAKTVIIQEADFTVNAVINAWIVQGDAITTICDDLILIEEAGSSSLAISEGSILESVLSSDVEARSLNRGKAIVQAVKVFGGKLVSGAKAKFTAAGMVLNEGWAELKGWVKGWSYWE
ncbi:hypothetical protein HKI87_07g49030 [Chloropicon roscoffensis]|uniref:Uncharacterized protein n=1 Tax=Chloropicon roscoffensis TaxID=1461544 RepID=A0AAX4PAH4_9CHLO